MLILISPAKTLDFETNTPLLKTTLPDQLDKSEQLIRVLKKKTPEQLSDLMKISSKLAMLNYQRFKMWQLPFNDDNAKPAVFAFKGDVYTGLDIRQFSERDLDYMQQHLRIISGLYGLLRPLDLIQPYRLEMGTKLQAGKSKNLYEFWGDHISKAVHKALKQQNDDVLINLASDEYFKSIGAKNLKAKIVTPVFRENRNGTYKFLSVYGKKARGMMTRFILLNRIKTVDDVKLFREDGYYYNERLSDINTFVFTRDR